MFGALLSWLTGGGINALAGAYAKHKDSTVESERIQAGVYKTQLDAALDVQRLANQVRLATAGFLEMRILTFLTAAPFVLHAGMVGLDTCFALGWRIAAYPAPFDQWEGAILLSFFGIGIAGMGIKAVTAAMIVRRR